MSVGARGALTGLCLLLTACSSDFWSTRYGPGGTIDPAKVDTTTDRQITVLGVLAQRYRVPQNDYFLLALAGFNYSDEICSFYLNNLHQFERRKNRVKDSLVLAGATTTAVMGAAQVTEQAVVYVTQVFGFSAGMVGIVADSYLYRLSPGILSGIVKAMHDAFRKNAKADEINSLQMAYYNIREYYSLCLPVTIEAKIEEYLAAVKAEKAPGTGNGASGVTLTPSHLIFTERRVPVVVPR